MSDERRSENNSALAVTTPDPSPFLFVLVHAAAAALRDYNRMGIDLVALRNILLVSTSYQYSDHPRIVLGPGAAGAISMIQQRVMSFNLYDSPASQAFQPSGSFFSSPAQNATSGALIPAQSPSAPPALAFENVLGALNVIPNLPSALAPVTLARDYPYINQINQVSRSSRLSGPEPHAPLSALMHGQSASVIASSSSFFSPPVPAPAPTLAPAVPAAPPAPVAPPAAVPAVPLPLPLPALPVDDDKQEEKVERPPSPFSKG